MLHKGFNFLKLVYKYIVFKSFFCSFSNRINANLVRPLVNVDF